MTERHNIFKLVGNRSPRFFSLTCAEWQKKAGPHRQQWQQWHRTIRTSDETSTSLLSWFVASPVVLWRFTIKLGRTVHAASCLDTRLCALSYIPTAQETDMTDEMRIECMETAVTAIEKNSKSNESAARALKDSMDKKYGAAW